MHLFTSLIYIKDSLLSTCGYVSSNSDARIQIGWNKPKWAKMSSSKPEYAKMRPNHTKIS